MGTFKERTDIKSAFLHERDLTYLEVADYDERRLHELQLSYYRWLSRQLRLHERELLLLSQA
jgi:hypothetical protein